MASETTFRLLAVKQGSSMRALAADPGWIDINPARFKRTAPASVTDRLEIERGGRAIDRAKPVDIVTRPGGPQCIAAR